MRISTKGRYALRLMLDVAASGGTGYVSLKDVAARQEISVKYLEQIAGSLSKAGMLRSSRGSQGGYQLTRPPEAYSLGEILRLTEGSLAPVACLECKPVQCPRAAECRTLPMWEKLDKLIDDYLEGITLKELTHVPDGGDFVI